MRALASSVFHLHPLRRCNLRCLHCYSDSSPEAASMLPVATACAAVTQAARWGYHALAVSGGEPMLYLGLATVLAHAADTGMSTSVVTNGLQCRSRAALDTLAKAATVTVSIDGLPERHDYMRQRKGAHDGARRAVMQLADAGMTTWVACGVTSENLDDIEEIAAHAACWGAAGIAFHVVEPAGRGTLLATGSLLTNDARVLLYASVALLASLHRSTIAIRADLTHRDTVLRHPDLLYAAPMEPGVLPASAMRVLVMNSDAELVPVCHGFHPRYALGRFQDDGWAQRLWDDFEAGTLPQITRLARQALSILGSTDAPEVLNPGDWLADLSHQFGRLTFERARCWHNDELTEGLGDDPGLMHGL